MDDELQDSQPLSWLNRFVVGCDRRGRWVVGDRWGAIGGIFTNKDAALHFARMESLNKSGAVCCVPDTVLLDFFSQFEPDVQRHTGALRTAA